MKLHTHAGRPYPLGATVTAEGINFAVFSRHAKNIFLELYQHVDDSRPLTTFELKHDWHRTGDVWHIFVQGLKPGQLYGYRVDGAYSPEENGHRFNVNKLLSDPYARAIAGRYNLDQDAVYGYDRSSDRGDLSFNNADSAPYTVKSMAMEPSLFDWENDATPCCPLNDSIIYEIHVKGFTIHPSSGVAHPGTFRGVIEKIPYLKELGITALEFMPVHEFNEGEPIGVDPITGQLLHNYWGYSSLSFFTPELTYSSEPKPGAHVLEFQQMVRALHQAGIEVILDVVFNHTGEGNELGPTLSFRGLDNSIYYMLEEDHRHYKNYSGCGNTVNCNHPVLKQLILDCLRYWVVEMHVDGFRFDLATILGRASNGEWIGDLSLLYDIGGDPILRGCKLIAEAWDAEGMYKVGGFPPGWAEWNGRFRDDVRRFIRGDYGLVPDLARRIGGSRDFFVRKVNPDYSINFITAHDGFTLRDLVSYREKHNLRNGEENRDGSPENFSCNWGVEGETDDSTIQKLRRQQAKNMLTILFISRGTPMILGGDELWRTQEGNNNTYCQDNELGWINWTIGVESQEIYSFVKKLIDLRRNHPAFRRRYFVDPFADQQSYEGLSRGSDITWQGTEQHRPDWSYYSHTLALHLHGSPPEAAPDSEDCDFYIIFNGWSKPLAFSLPLLPPPLHWHRLVDTSLTYPEDFLSEDQSMRVSGHSYMAAPHSTVILRTR